MKKQIKDLEQLTESVKKSPAGQETIKAMPTIERWVNDISPTGEIIGRLEMYSGRYEKIKA